MPGVLNVVRLSGFTSTTAGVGPFHVPIVPMSVKAPVATSML